MPSIERAGAHIHYDIRGEGPPLLLGHSLLFDGRMWDDLLPALSKHHRVVNIDARCHRHSTTRDRFTLWDLADDWIAIMDKEQIDRALLGGLSMGGMTAMRLALKAPERVRAMVLLDTSADPEVPRQRRQYRALAEIQRAARMDFLVYPIVERKMFSPTTRRLHRDVVERGMGIIREKDPKVLYPAVRAVFDRESITDRLAAITAPTLVMTGEDDIATPPLRARRIADRIPGATLELIPLAGHVSVMEQPAEAEKKILEFLARHPMATTQDAAQRI